jgi:hypothetical protein
MFQKGLLPCILTLLIAGLQAIPDGRATQHEAGPAPSAERSGLASPHIATARQWIERGRREVRVYRSGKPVQLTSFTQAIVVTPLGRAPQLESLVRRSVALLRSQERADRWEVYSDVPGMGGNGLVMAENVFIVRQVLLSSRKHRLQLKLNGQAHRLKPGEALLLLGS